MFLMRTSKEKKKQKKQLNGANVCFAVLISFWYEKKNLVLSVPKEVSQIRC